ncbi:MAG: peptidase domain protein, partial [Acidobacteria bacterium]|nr:peptidase domain protein [Acidobacteriota bacterium]
MIAVKSTKTNQPQRTQSSQRFFFFSVLCGLCGYFVFVSLSAQTPPDRSRPPAVGPAPQLTLPSVQKRTLSNGLAVWVVEAHDVPIVQVAVVVRAGSGDDPAERFGAASLTSAMLDEGAGTRSALEIADAVEFLGATLSTTSSFDASAVRLNVPAQRLQEALPLLADVTLRPSFPEMELQRLRQERLTSLLQVRDNPSSIAAAAFARIVFGSTHRYGTGGMGTEANVKLLSGNDLRAFHVAYYQPANATLVVVGDITPDAVLPGLEKHFGPWNAAAPLTRRAPVPAAPQLARGQIYLVHKPDAEQSQIRIGWVGVPRSTGDYFPLLVLNTVLGGSFTSRLNQNLREEHGYAYGASSGFDMRLSAGPFVAAAGVQTDKTAEALREFFNELAGIAAPVGADELAKARNYIALGFPSEFESSGDLSRRLEELIVYQLPDDYFARYVANVQAVTAEAVRKAAATHIQPARFAVVVVGDRAHIEAGVRALNLGPVRV